MITELQTRKPNGDSVRSLLINALPTSANGLPPRPFQIVSLLDMLRFYARRFSLCLSILDATAVAASKVEDRDKLDMELSDDDFKAILNHIEAATEACRSA